MSIELKVPQAGESITEVQIGEWLVAEGEHVSRDQTVAEIETDKASMELAAPAAGRITRQLKKAGDFAKVGEVIALIEEAAAGAPPNPAPAAPDRP
ncbi:MAG: dihydrolipoamide succinyltransferase, partial [Phycisphaerae bacterium]